VGQHALASAEKLPALAVGSCHFFISRMSPKGVSAGWHLADPVVLTGLAGFVLLVSWYLASVTYRDDVAPTVVADAAGIQLRKVNGMPSSTVRWKDVRGPSFCLTL
jgi:hypothetical protein